MKIRPKNIPIFQTGGISTVTLSDPNSNWFTRVGNHGILEETYKLLEELFNKYKLTRDEKDYAAYEAAVNLLNEDLKKYALGYHEYTQNNNQIFTRPFVSEWQSRVKEVYPYINSTLGIRQDQYLIESKNPNTGDNEREDWHPDGYWAALTLDRTPWGYLLGDDNSDYNYWANKFKGIGIDYYSNNNVLYGRLNKDYLSKNFANVDSTLNNNSEAQKKLEESSESGNTSVKNDEIPVEDGEIEKTFWEKLKSAGQNLLNNPNLYSAGRFINDWLWNEKIYNESLKGIRPVLKQSYHTHRQVLGDEATKQAFYRRAAQGLTRAAQPFTSDADRQMAYQYEAKQIGDQLRALGDLADNQEIRRTSAESSQHEDANMERDNLVANYNIESLVKTNALRHNLLAQKYSALGSSVDNLLKEILTRKLEELAKLKEIDDLIYALKEALYEDLDFIEARNKYNEILKSKTDPTTKKTTWDKEMIAAREEYLRAVAKSKELKLIRRRRYVNGDDPFLYKQGSKIVRKQKDDLLYKSGRDTVEHFRKMSKMSSDAQNRKQHKIEKLAPHPKGNTKKYLLGGVAPFLVYTPAVRGGETTTSSETSTSSTKKSEENEGLDLLKKLFERLYSAEGLGLPSDLNGVFSSMRELMERQYAFGNELTTDEIQMEYLEQMLNLSILKFNKEQFEKIQLTMVSNDAQHEYAINDEGKIAAQSLKTGEVKFMDWENIKKSNNEYVPITNQTLLHLRAYSPDLAFDRSTLEAVANNGIGLSKIVLYLNTEISRILGTSEEKIEGYTLKESDIIKEGLVLLKEAPEGVYKFSKLTKDLNDLIEAALAYLTLTLPRGMRNVLNTRAKMVGISYNDVIKLALRSKNSPTSELSFDAMTGKAAKDANGNSSSKTDGESENSAALAFVLGQGPRVLLDFNPGTSNAIRVLGIQGILLDNQRNNLGQGATLLDVSLSQFAFLNFDKATFGGSKLNPGAYSHIILNNSTIIGMDLPYITDLNGNDVPDFTLCQKMEEADKIIAELKVDSEDYEKINEIYKSKGLPLKYNEDGEINTLNYKRFAGILVTLDEKSLVNKEAILADEVTEAEDVERDLYESAMKKKDKDYNLSSGWIGIGKDKLYKGTLFIPYDEDVAFAALSGGKPFKLNLPNNSAEVLLRQYAPKAKTYNDPAKNFSQIK